VVPLAAARFRTRLVVANHRLGFGCFLKHTDKKSKHDCFSFLQRNMQIPNLHRCLKKSGFGSNQHL
jgi:hypothetical protein